MNRTFEIAPTSNTPYIFVIIFGVFMAVMLALAIYYGFSIKQMKFEVSDAGLRVSGGFYGRLIPKEALMLQEMKVINLEQQRDFQPVARTNGTGLPGFSEGWFRLRNNEKALVFVSDKTKVVYIPTNQNYVVMLSPNDPYGFSQTLATIGGSSER